MLTEHLRDTALLPYLFCVKRVAQYPTAAVLGAEAVTFPGHGVLLAQHCLSSRTFVQGGVAPAPPIVCSGAQHSPGRQAPCQATRDVNPAEKYTSILDKLIRKYL